MSSATPFAGQILAGRYKVVSHLNSGGMGSVYRGELLSLSKPCALKVLDPLGVPQDRMPEFVKRFVREASVLSKLRHPNTVKVFEHGCDNGVCFIAMEYIEGRSLADVIRSDGPLPESRVLRITRQICGSVEEAHNLGAIHRDLKPLNILLLACKAPADFVKVIDFGLARVLEVNKEQELTAHDGMVIGTPEYMAPEQAMAQKADARSDIYSVGVMMFEMLAGTPPFRHPSSMHTMLAQVKESVPSLKRRNPDLEVSTKTERIVLRCLQKNPRKRFQSMHDLLSAIADAEDSIAQANVGSGVEYRARETDRPSDSCRAVPNSQSRGSFSALEVSVNEERRSQQSARARQSAPPIRASRALLTAIAFAVLGFQAMVACLIYGASLRSPKAPEPSRAMQRVAPVEIAPVRVAAMASETTRASASISAFETITITTVPPGAKATLRAGAASCSPTPCSITFRKATASAQAPRDLQITMPGFQTKHAVLAPGQLSATMQLSPSDGAKSSADARASAARR